SIRKLRRSWGTLLWRRRRPRPGGGVLVSLAPLLHRPPPADTPRPPPCGRGPAPGARASAPRARARPQPALASGITAPAPRHLFPINGAAHHVGKQDTAWSYRDATWAHVIVGVDPDPANNDKIIGWTKAYWEALHPYSVGGAYVNFMMDEGEERIKATYRDNY